MAFPDPQNSVQHTFGVKKWLYDGEKWNLQPTGGGSVIISPDEPPFASEGDLWVDENTYYLYVYKDDVWVGLTGPTGGSVTFSNQPPSDPKTGDFWVERSTYLLYFYDGTNWAGLTHTGHDNDIKSLNTRVAQLEELGFLKLE
jgi:hypothetical protein